MYRSLTKEEYTWYETVLIFRAWAEFVLKHNLPWDKR